MSTHAGVSPLLVCYWSSVDWIRMPPIVCNQMYFDCTEDGGVESYILSTGGETIACFKVSSFNPVPVYSIPRRPLFLVGRVSGTAFFRIPGFHISVENSCTTL